MDARYRRVKLAAVHRWQTLGGAGLGAGPGHNPLQPREEALLVDFGGREDGLHVVKDVGAQRLLQAGHQLLALHGHALALQRAQVHVGARNGVQVVGEAARLCCHGSGT